MMKYKSIHSDIWLASRYNNSTKINVKDNTYHNSCIIFKSHTSAMNEVFGMDCVVDCRLRKDVHR